MGKGKKKNQPPNRFRTGSRSGGCEALLYEFRQRQPAADSEPEDQESTAPPLGSSAIHIAASTFEEAFAHLRWERPHFKVDSVQCLGLITMVSGSPLD